MEKFAKKFMEFQHRAMAAAVVASAATSDNRGQASKVPVCLLLVVGFVMMMAGNVFAVTPPTDGTFAYDIYDLAVKDILGGPIGFVGGAAAVVMGGVMAVKNQFLPAVAAVLGGAAILKSESITQSLGMLF
jgi:hypothetical protein